MPEHLALVQGETRTVYVQLSDQNGPVLVSNYTPINALVSIDGTPTSITCTVFDAVNGIVSVPMTASDVTETAGVFEMTIRAYTSSDFIAFPSTHPLVIRVRELTPPAI